MSGDRKVVLQKVIARMSEINKQVYAFFVFFSSDLSSGGET